MAILSQGIELGMGTPGATPSYSTIPNLQTVPDLGGDVEQIDVTCLGDSNFKYIPGLKNFGSLEFTFIYDNATTGNFRTLKAAEGVEKAFQVSFPDGTKFSFTGKPHVKVAAASVNAPLTFTCSIALSSDITVTDPV